MAEITSKPRIRQWVIVFAITLAVITYIDRVCISQAAVDIQRDLGLSKEQMSWVFAVFTLAYGLFEVPFGWLGDKLGPRRMLMRVVMMWSVFTAATGWAWSWISMMTCRFLFGAGEAGCFPNITKVFTIWLPSRERVRAQGLMWLSARWGGAFTPLLVVWVLGLVGWRWAFTIFGAIGIVWAVCFYIWFRDDPRSHPAMSKEELALLDGADMNAAGHCNVPWKQLLTSSRVWLLYIPYFCMNYGWYFYITWLPTYLREARGVSLEKGALLAGLPLFFGGLGSLFSGLIAARAAEKFGTARSRRLLACTGLACAAAMLVLSPYIQSPTMAMLVLGLASFSNDLAMPGAWGACMDIGGRFSGSLSGTMNMLGQAGGTICPIAVAYILKYTGGNWNVAFWAAATAYAIGAICWVFIDPVTPLEKTPSESQDQSVKKENA
ncbi:MAG: MFS transporter [Kiritimatiellae bacterium]|nr:MFS transporter [Kiritimatiellia bacterium]MDD5519281.1 MFS transporter [Kiritimatiellia bacterium]